MAITLTGTDQNIILNDATYFGAPTTFGAIGSFAVLSNFQTTSLSLYQTFAGTSLYYVNSAGNSLGAGRYLTDVNGQTGYIVGSTGAGYIVSDSPFSFANLPDLSSLSGTWRAAIPVGSSSFDNYITMESAPPYYTSNITGGYFSRLS